MTSFEIDLRSEEELGPLYASTPVELFTIPIDLDTESGRLKYEKLSQEQLKRVIFVNYEDLEFMSKWEKWSEKQKDFRIDNYLLFLKENPKNKKLPIIYFINIQETASTLQQNYQLFKEVSGEDFDPFDKVFEINRQKSLFWDSVMTDDRCRGILFGFGPENSWIFYWKYNTPPNDTDNSACKLKGKPSEDPPQFKIWTIEEFPIPGFVSFSENDAVIKKYQKQREKIMEIYKGRDFVEVSLEKLTEKKKD